MSKELAASNRRMSDSAGGPSMTSSFLNRDDESKYDTVDGSSAGPRRPVPLPAKRRPLVSSAYDEDEEMKDFIVDDDDMDGEGGFDEGAGASDFYEKVNEKLQKESVENPYSNAAKKLKSSIQYDDEDDEVTYT